MFWKTEAERQADVDESVAKLKAMEAETEAQHVVTRQYIETNLRLQQDSIKLAELSRQNIEAYARILAKWEEQANRLDAILAKWEQMK